VTEDEQDLLHEVCNEQFWKDFGRLVGETLNKISPHLWEEALQRMQEKASVYGSGFTKHLKR
jgi:hypothetical protein